MIRHDNSPAPGTEISVRLDQKNISAVIQAAMIEMNLSIEDLTWIHPEYEQQVRDNFMSESKVEANAIAYPNN